MEALRFNSVLLDVLNGTAAASSTCTVGPRRLDAGFILPRFGTCA